MLCVVQIVRLYISRDPSHGSDFQQRFTTTAKYVAALCEARMEDKARTILESHLNNIAPKGPHHRGGQKKKKF